MKDIDSTRKININIQSETTTRKIIAKLNSLLEWVFSPFSSKEVKIESEDDLEKRRKRLLSRYPVEELVSGGERSIQRLEEAKLKFYEIAGRAGDAFIARHVDPVLQSLKSFVLSLKENTNISTPSQSGFKNALGTVELIALARDEHRPWKKIRESTEFHARQALLEDIAFLRAYPSELLASTGVSGAELRSTLMSIEKSLSSILEKIEKLLGKHPVSEDLYSLYSWRTTLDQERQHLHDIGLKYIEEHVSPYKLKYSIEEGTFLWRGKVLDTLCFEETTDLFLYLFDLVKSSESIRSDERFISFFTRSKEHLHILLHAEEKPSEEERMRLFQTIRLIEELIGSLEEQ